MSTRLLGVHLIVRNEEDCLERCLQSLVQLAEETIVIDTGSTDRTIEIAHSYGAKVFFYRWEDDFSAVRNFAISQATTDWVLIMDADEELVSGAEQVRDFLEAAESDLFTVEIENCFGEQGWEKVTSKPSRLFRREKGFRFLGIIHEQLVLPDDSPAPQAASSPLRLRHDGYLPTVIQKKKKAERNLQIIEKLVKQKPDDPFQLYNLGVTQCQLRNPVKAAESFVKALTVVPEQSAYRPTLIRDTVKVWQELERWEDAVELLHIECYRYPDYADLHHLEGVALEHLGRLPEAFDSYRKATETGSSETAYVTEAGIGSFRTRHAMARIACRLGDLEQANALYTACLENHPVYEPALPEWTDLLQRLGTPDDRIAELVHHALGTGRSDNRIRQARLLASVGAYTHALSILKAETGLDSDDRQLLLECLLQTGQLREAYERMTGDAAGVPQQNRRMWIIDQALCRWSEELELPFRFYKQLTTEEQHAFERLDLLQKTDACSGAQYHPEDLTLVEELIKRAVGLNLIRIADRLARLSTPFAAAMPKLLYRHGFVLGAADRFLTLLKQRELDVEGLYMLGEIVYDKGHYEHSAPMFEEVLLQIPDHYQARIGSSLCYLQLARHLLQESLERAPDHPAFRTDLQRIDSSIRLLNATDWHTSWDAAARRNRHATPPDIAVHDR
jgi:glycosyltransferase involved in cell wall biosynthesis